MHVWTAEKPSFTKAASASDSRCGRIKKPVQWGNFYTGWTEVQQESSVAGCLISELDLKFFTFRDPEVPPSCKKGQRDTTAVWSHHVIDYQVWLFLYLDTVWEGEMSGGVRAGKGREKKEMRGKRSRGVSTHCSAALHRLQPQLNFSRTHQVTRMFIWNTDAYLGGNYQFLCYLCNVNSALLDSVDHAEVFSVRPSLISWENQLQIMLINLKMFYVQCMWIFF